MRIYVISSSLSSLSSLRLPHRSGLRIQASGAWPSGLGHHRSNTPSPPLPHWFLYVPSPQIEARMEREQRRRSISIHGNRVEFSFSSYPNGMDQVQISSNTDNDGNGLDRRPSSGSIDCYGANHHRDHGDTLTNHLLPVSSSSPSASTSSRLGYIEHHVSKFDTLAGVAIRYGVEVADVKRLNGLVTDIQMFALKSLHIPLPGRHPPSTCLPNGSDDRGESNSERSPPRHAHVHLFDSFQSLRMNCPQLKVTPAMSSLQGYYGLDCNDEPVKTDVLEMAAYQRGGSYYLEDGLFMRASPTTHPPLSRHRKSKSLVIDFLEDRGDASDHMLSGEELSDRWIEKLVRRRQKSESNFAAMTPEMVLREDISGGSGGFSAKAGKGLALRSKATASRTSLLGDADATPTGLGDVIGAESSLTSVRKSSSTSSLQDQETSSIWPASKWSLRPDLQLLSTAAISRPIFDGLPKPLTSRRNKAALD